MFDFADSPIANRYKVAAFLSDLFPKSCGSGSYEGWREVSGSIKVFRDVREQERLSKD
jgi:hypothetical protein